MAAETLETFGERLRRLRQAKGWTMARLARELECTGTIISYWENGHKYPQVVNLAMAAQALGVSMDYLWFGADEQTARAALLALIAAQDAEREALSSERDPREWYELYKTALPRAWDQARAVVQG